MQNEFKIVPIPNKRIIDITGERYGRLVVLGLSDKKPRTNFVCQCDCGNKIIARSDNLTRGDTKSCGCYKSEEVSKRPSKRNYTHGEYGSRLNRIFNSMKQRCNNLNHSAYSRYGGRGIKVCPEWEESYVAFATWARENGYQDDLSIDRIDNDGDYEPNNCRWSTPIQQQNNRRNNVLIEYQNEERALSEWANILNIERNTLFSRYYRGDRGDRLFRPVENKRHLIKIEYRGKTFAEWSRITGIDKRTLSSRYDRGDRDDRLFRPVGKYVNKIDTE